MDKTSQNLVATALVLIGVYALIYSEFISVPFRISFVLFGFWIELLLLVALLYRLRRAPLVILPATIAILGVLIPSASSALSWSAWSINGFAP